MGLLLGRGCAACGSAGPRLCAHCAAGLLPVGDARSAPGIASIVTAWQYSSTARSLVLELKLRGRRAPADALARGMCSALLKTGCRAEAVTWVPGRRADIRQRGFDHAEILGRAVAAGLGLPAQRLLVRLRAQPDQAGLSGAARLRNLDGVFASRGCSRPVLLVDDLVTTGATVRVCIAALRAAGAPRVEVVAACRA